MSRGGGLVMRGRRSLVAVPRCGRTRDGRPALSPELAYRFALLMLLQVAAAHRGLRGAGHGTDPNTGGGGPGVATVWDGAILEAWTGTAPTLPTTIPTGTFIADFAVPVNGFDVTGNQLAAWEGTAECTNDPPDTGALTSSDPTFFVLRSVDNTHRLVIPVGTGAGKITLSGTGWGIGDALTISGGLVTGTSAFQATCTKGALRVEPLGVQRTVSTVISSIPAAGSVVVVESGDDPQTKYNATSAGDILAFRAGQTWTLPAGSSLTLAVGHASILTTTGTLPSEGTRMTAALAVTHTIPKLISADGREGIVIGNTAGGYIGIRGLEVTCSANDQPGQFVSLLQIGADDPAGGTYVHHVLVSQCYFHGQPNAWRKSGVLANGTYIAFVDNTIKELHYGTYNVAPESNSDVQAITVAHGNGPFHIRNNYLESSHEPFAVGSTSDPIRGVCFSDLTFRLNYLSRPLAWRGLHTCKNVFETKKCRRALIEANVFENCWVDNQNGAGMVLGTGSNVSQSKDPVTGVALIQGSMPWSQTCDITIRYNWFKDIAIGIQIDSGYHDHFEFQRPTIRFAIRHNVFTGIGVASTTNPSTGSGKNVILQVNDSMGGTTGDGLRQVTEIALEHNSAANNDGGAEGFPSWIQCNDTAKRNFVVRSNTTVVPWQDVSIGNNAAIVRGVGGTNDTAWNVLAGSGSVWKYNAMVDPNHATSGLPAHADPTNHYTNNGGDIAFVSDTAFYTASTLSNLAGVGLSGSSLYLNTAHDGTNPGADVAAVMAALAGVGP